MSAIQQLQASIQPAAGGGTITEVGSGSQRFTMTTLNGGDSQNGAFPANVTSGNLLVVGGAYWKGATIASVNVTDTRSTSYTTALGTQVSGWCPWVAYGLAPSSGACTVTVDPDGAVLYGSCAIDEFTGVNASPVDASAQVATGTSTAPTVSITTATAGALLIGAMSNGGASNPGDLTPGASYTQIGELEDSASTWDFNFEFRIVTTATSYNVDWTTVNNSPWSAVTIAFKP